MNLKSVTEGILFVVGDEGITIKELSEVLSVNETEVKEILTELRKDYESKFNKFLFQARRISQ